MSARRPASGVSWIKSSRSDSSNMGMAHCVEVAAVPADPGEVTEAERDMLAIATAVGVTKA